MPKPTNVPDNFYTNILFGIFYTSFGILWLQNDISKRFCLILRRFKLGIRGFSFNTSRSLLSYMQQLSGRIIEEEMTIFF